MRLTHGSPLCRTISPPMVGVTSSILLPNLREKNYKLRHGMINMIEGMQFHGLPSKDFVLHLRKFLRLTNTVRSLANAHFLHRWPSFLLPRPLILILTTLISIVIFILYGRGPAHILALTPDLASSIFASCKTSLGCLSPLIVCVGVRIITIAPSSSIVHIFQRLRKRASSNHMSCLLTLITNRGWGSSEFEPSLMSPSA